MPPTDENIDKQNPSASLHRAFSAKLRQKLEKHAAALSERFLRILNHVLPENGAGDSVYHTCRFILKHKRIPSRKRIFNDVLFHIKNSREISDPLRVFVTDKEYLKIYVAGKIGPKYNVPTLAVLRSPGQARTYEYPASCCIKPTHASGQILFRRDGEDVDFSTINGWFSMNFYNHTRERNYKPLTPKVIVEPLIFGQDHVDDYKFFCVNGEPKLLQLNLNRFSNHEKRYYDMNWKEQRGFSILYKRTESKIKNPRNFHGMVEIAAKLSQGFGFVRIDLYTDGKNILVGEITNCHQNAEEKFIPKNSELTASKMIFG